VLTLILAAAGAATRRHRPVRR